MMKKDLTNIARGLRRNATEAEKSLWQRLSRKQMEGFKFRRQQPIGKYVVDFVTFDKKLIIELDGGHFRACQRKAVVPVPQPLPPRADIETHLTPWVF
jgi:very-short-patch-repair endonuclease